MLGCTNQNRGLFMDWCLYFQDIYMPVIVNIISNNDHHHKMRSYSNTIVQVDFFQLKMNHGFFSPRVNNIHEIFTYGWTYFIFWPLQSFITHLCTYLQNKSPKVQMLVKRVTHFPPYLSFLKAAKRIAKKEKSSGWSYKRICVRHQELFYCNGS